MQVVEMVAGRELDSLVAEKIMGWHCDGNMWVSDDGGAQRDIEWSPSTDISDAWRVVEHMQHQFGLIGINNFVLTSQADGTWYCEFPQPKWMEGTGETAPLAICKAALRACGE